MELLANDRFYDMEVENGKRIRVTFKLSKKDHGRSTINEDFWNKITTCSRKGESRPSSVKNNQSLETRHVRRYASEQFQLTFQSFTLKSMSRKFFRKSLQSIPDIVLRN